MPDQPATGQLNVRWFKAGAVITAGLMVLLAWLLYFNVSRLTRSEREVRHAQYTIRSAENLYANILSAESSVRAFLATGHNQYLADFAQAVPIVQRENNFLRQTARNRPRRTQAVQRLSAAVKDRLDALEDSILLRKQGPLPAAAAAARIKKGTQLSADVLRETDALTHLAQTEISGLDLGLVSGSVQSTRLLAIIFITLFLFMLATLAALLRGELVRRRTENELADAHARLRSVLDSATQISIIATDPRGNITVFNKGAERLLGYAAAEMIGKTPVAIHLMSEVAARGAELTAALGKPVAGFDVFVEMARNGHYEKREWTYVRKDGTQFPVELTVTSIRDHEGAVTGFLGMATDISSRKHSQLQMRKLSTAVKASPSSIVITDRDGNIEYANPKFFELTGYTELELIGQNPKIISSGKNPKGLYKELWDTILSGRTWEGEFLNRKKNGELFWEHAAISPVKDPHGDITNFIAVKIDITDRKVAAREMEKARDAAVQLARMKSEFLANMSHEIRTPMNAIIGMTGLLLDTDLTARQREYIRTVATAGEALLDIINDILDFSKIESGNIVIETMDFDLSETVESTADLLAPRAQGKDIELLSYIDGDVPTNLRGDQGRLRQVLMNLIGNAIKFTDRGEVVLKISSAGGPADKPVLRFEIRDTGIGISAEAQKKLFQVFSQADASTTRKYGGTGLGLSISKRLVELMGGSIGVESEEGWGSKFWFTLPFEKSSGAVPARPKAQLQGIKALVVDDNAASREIASRHLRNWEMAADTASSAQEGLEALRREAAAGSPYKLLLTDMQMPGMDGLMLAKAMAADPVLASTPRVMMTSLGQEPAQAERAEAGIAAFIHKPLRPSALLNAVNAALNGPGAAPEQSQAPSREAPQRKYFHVLVAEDNAVNQKVAVRQLEKLGYTADVAANGLEAVEAVKRQPYDLVLMDCQMPEMDGFQATAEIRRFQADQRRTPIVAMTANALQGDQERCLAAGMDGYIAKPVRMEVLAEVMARWDAAIDPVALKDLAALGGAESAAFLAELASVYLKDLPGRLDAIRSAARAGDAEALRLAAHALKGSSANMGVPRVQKICLQLEEAGRAGSLEGTPELLSELEREAAQARAALEKMAAGAPKA